MSKAIDRIVQAAMGLVLGAHMVALFWIGIILQEIAEERKPTERKQRIYE